jgi:hypothetical protein
MDKAKEFKSSVAAMYDGMLTNHTGPFDKTSEDIYKDPDFNARIQAVGMKLYLNMLDTNGTLPGKQEIAEAVVLFTAGMSEKEKALLAMCCHEASAEAGIAFRTNGRMTSELGRAAGNPKAVEDDLLLNKDIK